MCCLLTFLIHATMPNTQSGACYAQATATGVKKPQLVDKNGGMSNSTICGICMETAIFPMWHKCGKHIFCHRCLHLFTQSARDGTANGAYICDKTRCLACRTHACSMYVLIEHLGMPFNPGSESTSNKAADHLKCPYCGARDSQIEHVTCCGERRMRCLKGCTAPMKLDSIATHRCVCAVCRLRPRLQLYETCAFCTICLNLDELASHLNTMGHTLKQLVSSVDVHPDLIPSERSLITAKMDGYAQTYQSVFIDRLRTANSSSKT